MVNTSQIADTSDTAVLNISLLFLKFVFRQEMWLVSKHVQLYREDLVSILAPVLHLVNVFKTTTDLLSFTKECNLHECC